MLSVLESTCFTWRLGVKTAPGKPRFIIVGFQTDKDDDQTKNPSTFDHVNLKNIYVTPTQIDTPRLIIICSSEIV